MSAKSFKADLGEFLGNFTNLVYFLIFYLICTFGTYYILKYSLPTDQVKNTWTITYLLATGGDPASSLQMVESTPCSFYWICFFHILSWLFIPVVIASVVDSTYRLHEKRQEFAEEVLRDGTSTILNKFGIDKSLVEEATNELVSNVKKIRREKKL